MGLFWFRIQETKPFSYAMVCPSLSNHEQIIHLEINYLQLFSLLSTGVFTVSLQRKKKHRHTMQHSYDDLFRFTRELACQIKGKKNPSLLHLSFYHIFDSPMENLTYIATCDDVRCVQIIDDQQSLIYQNYNLILRLIIILKYINSMIVRHINSINHQHACERQKLA